MTSRTAPSGAGPAPARVVRGVAVAAAATLLTALGHVAGGGALPGLGLLIVLFPLLAMLVTSTADRARGPVGTLVVLGAGEAGQHELMSLLGHDHGASGGGWRMLAFHSVTTVLCGLLLRDADRLLGAMARALGRVLPRRPGLPRIDAALPTLALPAPGLAGHVRRAAVGALVLRGPPAGPIPQI